MQSELRNAIDSVRGRFGEQALVRARRLPQARPWASGQAVLDCLSGIGGLPRGRLSVLAGTPSSGRLSLGLDVLARASRELAQTMVLDSAGRFDVGALEALGAELPGLTVVRPPTTAAAGEAAVALARAGAGLLLALGELPEPALAPLEAAAARSGCAVLVLAGGSFAQALAHASSLTLELRRSGWLWERGLLVGLRAEAGCLKNRLAAPGATARLEIRYPLGDLVIGEPVRVAGDAASPVPSAVDRARAS